MKWQPLLGTIAVAIPHLCIAISIAASPWFSWAANALSDLGHPAKSAAAPIFNTGLIAGGILISFYAVTVMARKAEISAILLAATGILLALVGVLNESYGRLHLVVSIAFFSIAGVTLLAYAAERRSKIAVLSAVVGFSAWLLYWLNFYESGIAVPETISALAGNHLVPP